MVGTVSGWLALTLLGAEPAPTPQPTQPKPIVCQARVMTINALDWRAGFNDQIRSVSRKKNTTVWVAHRSVGTALLKLSADKQFRHAQLVCPTPETPASASLIKSIDYVQHQEVGQIAPVVAEDQQGKVLVAVPMPEIRVEQARVDEKFEVDCSARRIEQGTLAKVRLADSHIVAMHKVPTFEQLKTVDFDFNIEGISGNATPLDLVGDVLDTVVETPLPALKFLKMAVGVADGIAGTVEAACNPAVTLGKVVVPEVVAATVEGEWLVPHDSVLIVSLGVHTGADDQGKAVVRDRLAILDFTSKAVLPSPSATAVAAALPAKGVVRVCEATEPPAVPIALSHLNMPTVPARSLPEAINKDGQVVDLPPLPEAYAAVDLNQISPGSPLASPQSPLVRTDRPTPLGDPQLARTSFETPDTSQRIGVDCGFDGAGNFFQTVFVAPDAAAKSAQLAALVEGFLRRGMEPGIISVCPAEACPAESSKAADCDDKVGDCPACPAAGCPDAKVQAAQPDGASVRATFATALQNPGTTETRFIPLGKGLALEVRVRVVPEPKEADDQTQAVVPRRVQELAVESDKLRQAGDEWQRFWFLDQPSHMMPFRTQGGTAKP